MKQLASEKYMVVSRFNFEKRSEMQRVESER